MDITHCIYLVSYYVNEISPLIFFCDEALFISIMFVRFIHVSACICFSLIFLAAYYFTVWFHLIYLSFLILAEIELLLFWS